MSAILQHIIALTIVAACFGVVAWQAVRALKGKRSRVGSCCATGCATPKTIPDKSTAAPKIAFVPVESLRRSRR